jgi:hypothetical protein
MTILDKLCIALFLLSLAGIGWQMFRQAYRRANPKPRGPFTRWQDGGRP